MRLKDYLMAKNISYAVFALMSKLSLATIYKASHGGKIRFSSAKKIVKASNGGVTLKDFGYE